MKTIKTVSTIVLVLLLAACKTPKNITYFQDSDRELLVQLQADNEFRLRPEDKINIIVNSKDPSLTSLFTLTTNSISTLGASSRPQTTAGRTTSSGSAQTIAYTVDFNGNIDFPVLGTIHAQGMTRGELAKYIKNELVEKQLVLDPVVTVEYVNMAISVLGEVRTPGRVNIIRDNYSILDAIADAGDLTINGERENVKVLRNVNGKLRTYNIDLCSAQSITTSPAYYLQQNDIVYITPNDKRKREATTTANTVLTPTFWISVASLLATITALVIK